MRGNASDLREYKLCGDNAYDEDDVNDARVM